MFYNITEDSEPETKIKQKINLNYYMVFLIDTYVYNNLSSP
jgi:hypothetical protein